MEWEADEKEVKAAGAELLPDGRRGLRIHGWEIESLNRSCLTSVNLQQWEEKLQTAHLPEMIFGDSSLILKHEMSGTKIHFNAFDALVGWKHEALPPVEVPAAAKWKVRSKLFQEVILDYDYTFTTPYCGSEAVQVNSEDGRGTISEESSGNLRWEESEEQIDLVTLASKEPILFYDEVILYEDELADNGVSLLTVKVRVMPNCWFLLLRFWLRVDGVLMRLRDTRMLCTFREKKNPVIFRESCWREATFEALASKGYPADSAAYNDPSLISQRLPVVLHKTHKLIVHDNVPMSCSLNTRESNSSVPCSEFLSSALEKLKHKKGSYFVKLEQILEDGFKKLPRSHLLPDAPKLSFADVKSLVMNLSDEQLRRIFDGLKDCTAY